MSKRQVPTRYALATLATATAIVTAIAFARSTLPGPRDAILALIFFGLQALAVLFPIELAPRQKLSLHTSVVVAAVLLVDPGVAAVIAGAGTFAAQIARRQPPDQAFFNSGQTALQAGAAGLLLEFAGGNTETLAFGDLQAFLAALGAVVLIYLIDVISVGAIVALDTGQPLLAVLTEGATSALFEDLSQFGLGLVAAMTLDAHLWTLPIFILFAIHLHAAGRRNAAAREVERLRREASEQTARARHEFLLIASHELKTPITSVKMAAQLLDRALIRCDRSLEVEPVRVTRWRDQLMLGIARLESLVSDLLDAARIQQGRLDLHRDRVDLVELARLVIERFEVMAEQAPRHRLLLDAPDAVEGYWDPSGLDHALTNLVSNALKYSPEGGDILVVIRARDDLAQLAVSDNGIGIEPGKVAELFEPFSRGVDIRHGIAGAGLGLYITKQVIERHAGSIRIESVLGAGTTITVELPRHRSDLDREPAAAMDVAPETSAEQPPATH